VTLTRRHIVAALAASLAPKGLLAATAPPLFPGEEIIEAAGYPSLVKFEKGDGQRPLVVFVPGTSFLARIAYRFPGRRDADFLSHWLVRAGFSFLGASYPLDNPVYAQPYPEFGITDWGRQVATAARRAVDANKLGNEIIVVGWSMGGKVAETVAVAARSMGLDLTLFVALDALPPGPNLFPGNAEQFVLAKNGLVDQAGSLMPWFVAMVEIQGLMNGHTIIPVDALRRYFTGNPPLNLQGEAARFVDGRIVDDVAAALRDGGVTDYERYPPIALIVSDSPADYPNVLLCRTNWALFMGQRLYRRHVYPNRDRLRIDMPAARWRKLERLIADAPARLTVQVPGTHSLFLGEQGARATAAAIAELAQRSKRLDDEIAALLG